MTHDLRSTPRATSHIGALFCCTVLALHDGLYKTSSAAMSHATRHDREIPTCYVLAAEDRRALKRIILGEIRGPSLGQHYRLWYCGCNGRFPAQHCVEIDRCEERMGANVSGAGC